MSLRPEVEVGVSDGDQLVRHGGLNYYQLLPAKEVGGAIKSSKTTALMTGKH